MQIRLAEKQNALSVKTLSEVYSLEIQPPSARGGMANHGTLSQKLNAL